MKVPTRSEYEKMYWNLCRETGNKPSDVNGFCDYELLIRINIILGTAGCVEFTSDELYELSEQMITE